MSEAPHAGQQRQIPQIIPVILLVGMALGAGGTYSAMQALGYRQPPRPVATDQAPAPGGMAAPGGAMMGMGGMGMGGGGARGKRNLTSLVGKLELLTRSNLHVELDATQSEKIAAKLAELDQLEKMTADDAQAQLDDLEALLTPEQKAVVDSIGLPFGGRPGGGGGPGAPGAPAGGGPPMGMMGGGGPPDENPFRQEANETRLHDLLGRLKPAATE